MKLVPRAIATRLARRRTKRRSRNATDVVRWAVAWSAVMAGVAWLFVRAWVDPAARGERRERVAFLKRILPPIGRKRVSDDGQRSENG